MSAPHNKPVAAVAQLTGVPEATLYLWRKQAREQGRAVPGDGQNPEQWSSADKFAVVLEAAPLNAAELAAYCRRKGLLVEQLERWRTEVHTALSAGQNRAGATERTADKKRIRDAGQRFAPQGEGLGGDGGTAGAVPKVRSAVERRRGRMIALPQRQELVADIEQARQDGAPLGLACAELGLSAHRRTLAWHGHTTLPIPSYARLTNEQYGERCHRRTEVILQPNATSPRPAQAFPSRSSGGR